MSFDEGLYKKPGKQIKNTSQAKDHLTISSNQWNDIIGTKRTKTFPAIRISNTVIQSRLTPFINLPKKRSRTDKMFKNLFIYGPPITTLGSHSEICGIKATSKRTMKIPRRYGHNSLLSSPILTLLILETAYRHIPTGGVKRPNMEASVITTPNWMGSILYCWIIGKNMGIVINRTAIPSRKQPRINKIMIVRILNAL